MKKILLIALFLLLPIFSPGQVHAGWFDQGSLYWVGCGWSGYLGFPAQQLRFTMLASNQGDCQISYKCSGSWGIEVNASGQWYGTENACELRCGDNIYTGDFGSVKWVGQLNAGIGCNNGEAARLEVYNYCPEPQSCPTYCGYPGGSVPNGSCGTTSCAATAPCCPATVTVSGSLVSAPAGAGVCADGTNCVSSTTNYSLTVSTQTSHNFAAKAVTYFSASPGPTNVSVGCTPVTGPTFTYSRNACTGQLINCGSWSSCAGTCPNGTQTRPCTDAGCGLPATDSQSCIPPSSLTISDGISNASQAVSICASKTGGSGCTNSVCSTPSSTSYSLAVNGSCTYELTAGAIAGRSVNPQGYEMTVGCFDTTGPRFWYNSAAGIVTSTSTINAGSGQVSEAGTSPGYRLENYTASPPLNKITYDEFLRAVNKNAGLSDSQNPCLAPGGVLELANYTFFCYNNTTYPFENVLTSALAYSRSGNPALVVYPDPAAPAAPQTIGTAKSLPANHVLTVFVNGDLTIQANISANPVSSGLVFILNSSGNLSVDSAVTQLDGVYLFPGSFTDVSGGNISLKLTGNGSLLNTGNSIWTLGRAYPDTSGSAEEWRFQPKYLRLYGKILGTPRFTWKELPPN